MNHRVNFTGQPINQTMVRFTKRNGCLSFCSQRFVLCAIICFVLYYLTFYNDNRHHLTKSTGTVTEYVTRGDSRTKTNNDTDADHGVGNRRFVDAKDNLYGAAGKIAGNIGAAGIVGEGHGDDKVTIAIVDQHQEGMLLFLLFTNFLSRIASSVLKENCYQRESCVGGPSVFKFPFGHRSRSHNICPLDNHLSGLSISLSSLALS